MTKGNKSKAKPQSGRKSTKQTARMPSDASPSVAVPTAVALWRHAGEPRITHSGDSCVIMNEEQVAEVRCGASYSSFEVPIQPGDATIFEWLAPIASRWEEYRIRRMCFHYENSNSTQVPGIVQLSPVYDPSTALPTSFKDQNTIAGTARGSAYYPFSMTPVIKNLMVPGTKFVRIAGEFVRNRRLTDAGKLVVGTSEGTGVKTGFVFCSYEIEFRGAAAQIRQFPAAPLSTFVHQSDTVLPSSTVTQSDGWGLGDFQNLPIVFSGGVFTTSQEGDYRVRLENPAFLGVSGPGGSFLTFTAGSVPPLLSVTWTGAISDANITSPLRQLNNDFFIGTTANNAAYGTGSKVPTSQFNYAANSGAFVLLSFGILDAVEFIWAPRLANNTMNLGLSFSPPAYTQSGGATLVFGNQDTGLPQRLSFELLTLD